MTEGVATEEIQWKVTWFPPDVARRSKIGTEDQVRRLAEEHEYEAPIIESRRVVAYEWQVMENKTIGLVAPPDGSKCNACRLNDTVYGGRCRHCGSIELDPAH